MRNSICKEWMLYLTMTFFFFLTKEKRERRNLLKSQYNFLCLTWSELSHLRMSSSSACEKLVKIYHTKLGNSFVPARDLFEGVRFFFFWSKIFLLIYLCAIFFGAFFWRKKGALASAKYSISPPSDAQSPIRYKSARSYYFLEFCQCHTICPRCVQKIIYF